MVDINPINPQSVTVNVSSNGSLTVNNTGGSTAQVSTNADAQLAYSWACGVGLIQGIDYSAKYWAGKAKESELIAVNAIQDIEDAKDDAIAELESAKDTCLNNIELAGDDKVAEIEGLASDYESILITLTNRAETAADNAETSKTNAANSASNAAASATSASTSASNANSSASSAAESANLASNSKEDARSYANSARQDMTKAQTAAGQANDSARSASQSEAVAIQAQATAAIARDAAQGYAQQAEQAKEDIEAELGNYVSTSSLTTILSDYVLSSDLSTTLADYVTSANLTTILDDYATKQWVNNQGYITGITSGDVTNALGFTPYNATNPDRYITSSALTPYALISSLATVATSGSYNDLEDKPYIPSGVIVDQTFDGTSTNSQSGVAIAGKLADYVLSDSSNSIDIYSETSIGFNAPETTDITANGYPIITSYNILSNDAYLTIGEYSNNYGIYLYDSDYVRFFYAEDGSSGLSAYSSNRQSHYAIDLLPSGISFGNEDYTTTITVPSNGSLAVNGSEVALKSDIPDISTKQDALVSGTNIKTINNTSLLGSGNIDTSEIFVAEYDVTSIGTLIGKYQIGKTIYLLVNEGVTAEPIKKYVPLHDVMISDSGFVYTFSFVEFSNGNTNLYTTGGNITQTTRVDWDTSTYTNVANIDLSNLSTTGQAIIDGKANTDLSNVSSIDSGSAVATALNTKVNNDDYYYKSGDTDSYSWYGGGYITASGTEIWFTIPTPKSMANITTVTCTALTTAFRKTAGGYMPSSGGNLWNAKANATVTVSKQTENTLSICVKYSNWGGTNNTPVGVLVQISLSFT